jgi:hypothetical protein
VGAGPYLDLVQPRKQGALLLGRLGRSHEHARREVGLDAIDTSLLQLWRRVGDGVGLNRAHRDARLVGIIGGCDCL